MTHNEFRLVYDILTGEVVKRLRGHDSCVRDVSWHPYVNEIVTSSVSGYTVFLLINGGGLRLRNLFCLQHQFGIALEFIF